MAYKEEMVSIGNSDSTRLYENLEPPIRQEQFEVIFLVHETTLAKRPTDMTEAIDKLPPDNVPD